MDVRQPECPVAASGWLIRRRFRRRWIAVIPVALIVMLGATGALVAAGAGYRTANAYSRYLERADVGDVVRESRDLYPRLRGRAGLPESLPCVAECYWCRTISEPATYLGAAPQSPPIDACD